MLSNFSIHNIYIFVTILLLCLTASYDGFGQSCPECGPSRTYTGSNLELNTRSNGANPSLAGGNWSGGSLAFTAGSVAQFDQPFNYIWKGSDFNLGGIILTNGANLTLDRPNEGNNEAFTISGNCIVVGSGSTLNLIYITSLANVTVCVEDGGKIVFDSRSGSRNEFSFDNVEIRLNGPNAELNFGEAEVNIGTGGLIIEGWTGSPENFCENSNPPIPGSSGNIFWNSSIQLLELCKILNGRVLPVEYISFTADHKGSDRSNDIKWITASEKNNSHFIIQRAINDIKSWEDLGVVNGAINSDMPIEYNFTDTNLPLAGGNIYYRLKQVDFDAKSSLGKVVSVRVGAISGKGTWRVFPNPNNGGAIRLELLNKEKYKGEEVSIRILSNYNSLDNKQIVTKDIFDLSNQLQQLLHPIGKGVAVLEIIWGNQVEHIKILKK